MFGMIVDSCPLKKLKSCLHFIHGVDDDTVQWLENMAITSCDQSNVQYTVTYKTLDTEQFTSAK